MQTPDCNLTARATERLLPFSLHCQSYRKSPMILIPSPTHWVSETENPLVPPIRPPERDVSQALNSAELLEAVLKPTEGEGNWHLC